VTRLHDLTAAEQLTAMRRREVSSRELTEHYLQRIERLSTPLGAFVTVTPDLALEAADAADALLAEGKGGALTGLPIGIKDLYATANVRTTAGSAAMDDIVTPQDSWTVGHLRRAGAVIVGKTSTSEFGATCYTEAYVTEHAAVTPFDTTRYSSGSSGGAATAVAAGLLPIGHGSDSAGSVRTPAATCNLVGVKPSRGLVSIAPASTFLAFGTEGPLARTVEDAALLLDAMAEPWAGDLYGWKSPESFADAAGRRPEHPLVVATWTESGLAGVETHPDVVAATRRTADILRAEGHDVREVAPPALIDAEVVDALRTWLTYAVAISAQTMVPPDRYARLSELTRYLMAEGQGLSGADVIVAQATLARYASAMLAAFEGFDVALTPTTAQPPVRLGHFLAEGLEKTLERMLEWSCPTPWANLTGQPAVALPAGFTSEGLPLSVQLTGRPRADASLLALATQVEGAQDWRSIHPPVWEE
jgi:amidase